MANHNDTAAPLWPLLLVEDDAVSARFLIDALAPLAAVDHAADAASARRLAASRRYALWLIDRQLPDDSGINLLAALRRQAGESSPPALALTADLDDATRALLLAQGFAAAEAKPITALRLRQCVGELLEIPSAAVWDDAVAERALGPDPRQWEALRQLLRRDLPGQCERIVAAQQAGDQRALRDELHRLKAACGFCGAHELGLASHALAASPDPTELARFRQACERLLADRAAAGQ